jgi:hypothetical protein
VIGLRRALYAVVLPISLGYAGGAAFVACKEFLPDPVEMDDLNADLATCRKEARAAKDAGASPESAYMRYEDCKRREGVEGVSP